MQNFEKINIGKILLALANCTELGDIPQKPGFPKESGFSDGEVRMLATYIVAFLGGEAEVEKTGVQGIDQTDEWYALPPAKYSPGRFDYEQRVHALGNGCHSKREHAAENGLAVSIIMFQQMNEVLVKKVTKGAAIGWKSGSIGQLFIHGSLDTDDPADRLTVQHIGCDDPRSGDTATVYVVGGDRKGPRRGLGYARELEVIRGMPMDRAAVIGATRFDIAEWDERQMDNEQLSLLEGGTYDARYKLLGSDAKGKIRSETEHGHVWNREWNCQLSITSYNSDITEPLALVPAVASVASTIIDARALSAMSASSSWFNLSRNAEIDVPGRSGLRRSAMTGLELTRYYIRLWALFFDCALEEAIHNKAMDIGIPSSVDLRANSVLTFSSWVSLIGRDASGIAAPMFADVASGSVDRTIALVMYAIAADELEGPACHTSKRCWPPIPGSAFLTTSETLPPRNFSITSAAVWATIEYLNTATRTKDQSEEAFKFVRLMVMRPEGCNFWGEVGRAPTVVRCSLPTTESSGLYLLPMALNAGNMAPYVSDILAPMMMRRRIAECVKASAAFLVGYANAATALIMPDWWSNECKALYCDDERTVVQMRGRVFSITAAAQAIIESGGKWARFGKHAMSISPASIGFMRNTAWRKYHLNMAHLMIIPTVMDGSSEAAALWGYKLDAVKIPLKRAFRLELLGSAADDKAIVNALCGDGVRVGLIRYDKMLGTAESVEWAPLKSTHWLLPGSSTDDYVGIIPVVSFATLRAYHSLRERLMMNAGLTWWIETDKGVIASGLSNDVEGLYPGSADAPERAGAEERLGVPGAQLQPHDSDHGDTDSERRKQSEGKLREEQAESDRENTWLRKQRMPTTAVDDGLLEISESDKVVRALITMRSDPRNFKAALSDRTIDEWNPPEYLNAQQYEWLLDSLNNVDHSTGQSGLRPTECCEASFWLP